VPGCQCLICGDLLPEKFLDFLDDFHKPVHFGLGVVEIKTRAGGGFHAEPVHERLRAVMPAAGKSNGALPGCGGHPVEAFSIPASHGKKDKADWYRWRHHPFPTRPRLKRVCETGP